MPIVTTYPEGVFCWIDLTTTDVAAAKAFYGGLFGWAAVDRPAGNGQQYTMMLLGGHEVAGVTPMSADMREMGAPPVWVSYINTRDIDATCARVAEAGGVVFVPPMDALDSGRLALVQDPTGAAFGLWSARQFAGAKLVNQPNTLVWNELQTRDPAAAEAFYRHVFGWTLADDGYTLQGSDGRPHGGLLHMGDNFPAEVPAGWYVYFRVDDLATTALRVRMLGGTVVAEPSPVAGMGQFILASDPQGAAFLAMEVAVPADAPPAV